MWYTTVIILFIFDMQGKMSDISECLKHVVQGQMNDISECLKHVVQSQMNDIIESLTSLSG